MQRTIKPEILLLVGFITKEILPPLLSNNTLAGFVGIACIFILLIGAAGIAQRNRISLLVFLVGFVTMFGAFLFDRVLDNTSLEWEVIGPVGSLLIIASIIISWVVSLIKKRRTNR